NARRAGGDRTAHFKGSTLVRARMGIMIVGIGTDLAEVARIRKSVEQFRERFLNRVYTDAERTYSFSKADFAERLAARFAAKEAGMKAIGTGWRRGVTWRDFEVINDTSGKPSLRLSGAARQIADGLGTSRISLSLTHTRETAFAVVILER
ncbi:MAG: holo-ACP synthase, partial [Bryobacteraceae bacterium]